MTNIFLLTKAPVLWCGKNIISVSYTHLGPEIFYEDAANIMMQEAYPAAIDESGVDIVSQPTVDAVSYTHLDVYKRQYLETDTFFEEFICKENEGGTIRWQC